MPRGVPLDPGIKRHDAVKLRWYAGEFVAYAGKLRKQAEKLDAKASRYIKRAEQLEAEK